MGRDSPAPRRACRAISCRHVFRLSALLKKQIGILIACGLLFLAPAIAGAQQPAESRELTTSSAPSHPDWPATPVRASKGMAVSDEALASQAGVEIMKQGGNAVDAAV